jgi:PD-(D/E)XK nuclease superfamily protein
VPHQSTNHKGNVAEAAIAAAAIKLGIDVLKPLVEHTRYDLIFDIDGRLLRVQCKWAPRNGEVVVVNLAGFRYTARGHVRSVYSADEIDAVAVYCEELNQCYLLPIDLVDGMRGLHLRLAPPRNGQRAALNWAADYELGAIAQLGERLSGTQEVAGSSPASSTSSQPPSGSEIEVGANKFRRLFGWYMERAAAGEEFLVRRRGKPYVKLSPAAEPLTVVPFPKKRLAAG